MNVERWIWPIQLKNYWKCLHCKTIKEGWFVEVQFGKLCPLWWTWGEHSKIRFTVSEVTVVKNVIIWLKLSQACTGIQKIPLQLIIDSGHKHISQESWKKKKKNSNSSSFDSLHLLWEQEANQQIQIPGSNKEQHWRWKHGKLRIRSIMKLLEYNMWYRRITEETTARI